MEDIDHKLLVKKIILSRFLEMLLEEYEEYIESLKINPVFRKLYNWKCAKHDRRIIKCINFPGTAGSNKGYKWPKNVLAEVMVREDRYLINYTNEWFTKKIDIDKSRLKWFSENEKLVDKKDASVKDLLIKVRLINIRNSITYRMLRGTIYFQKDFFINKDDPYYFKILSFLDVSKWIKNNFKHIILLSYLAK